MNCSEDFLRISVNTNIIMQNFMAIRIFTEFIINVTHFRKFH